MIVNRNALSETEVMIHYISRQAGVRITARTIHEELGILKKKKRRNDAKGKCKYTGYRIKLAVPVRRTYRRRVELGRSRLYSSTFQLLRTGVLFGGHYVRRIRLTEKTMVFILTKLVEYGDVICGV